MSETITEALENTRTELYSEGVDCRDVDFRDDRRLVIKALDYAAANADHFSEFFEMKQEGDEDE